ncbi:Uncharacterized protein BM_BM6062 [Brugia malayi]|uniref:Insulin-like domain-containing protein n=1 Tax=Brugia malayi TaxID=6279 RepID=A0A4E9FS20_BRUMA|nr:Uncharacterized protein BM_BM6062 [Brugia malayi]VIO98560.1 Uncharacterized protein BM_BM6062 [Brugia malayi]
MKLCPSGGKSFITAWHLSCIIKKKRSSSSQASEKQNWKKDAYRPLSMIEMMHYCCNVGCKIKDLLPYCDPFDN